MAIAQVRRLRRHRRGPAKGSALAIRASIGLLLIMVLSSAAALLLSIGAVAGVYAYYTQDLPDPSQMGVQTEQIFKTTKIYDRTGKHLLYEVFDPHWGNRTEVPVEQMPEHLKNATIAIEDESFYDNPGIDLRGFARAAWSNLRGQQIQGGSSITMQVVKNVLISPEERYKKSYERKIKETILALEISRLYSKDQILEWYLNHNNYGNLSYGVQAAAQAYFGKDVQGLSLAECAMLAHIPQSPWEGSPLQNPQEAKKRQHLVLDAMLRQGYITQEESVAAKYEDLSFTPQRFDIVAPHFVMYVRRLLEEKYGPDLVYQGGLKVYTTVDLDIHNKAQELARKHIAELKEQEADASNASVVVMNPKTGEILTMLGSLDYFDREIDGQVNVALAERQPGSSFKPFNYVTAFAQSSTLATMVLDVRTSFPDPPNPPYVPENYDREYHGPVLLREALACSYNIPAVKVLSMAGVNNVIDTAHRMGITTLQDDHYGLSLTLGGGEVKLLDMAYAFGVFANKGVMAGQLIPPNSLQPGMRRLDPAAILRVESSDGQVLEEYKSPVTEQVLSPQLAFLITDILSDNRARTPAFGPNSALKLSRPAAAKTGTTDSWKDNWTLGYTPSLVVGVWVGNSDNTPMKNISGLAGAAPIWHDLMESILASTDAEEFERPDGLERVEVAGSSGQLPTAYSPSSFVEFFLPGTAPTEYDSVHQAFRICKDSGKLATAYCPEESVEERVYLILPPEASDWVRDSELPQPPVSYCDVHGPNLADTDVALSQPRPYAYVHGQVPIWGNARSADFQLYRLVYGQGMNPSTWVQVGSNRPSPVTDGLLETWDVSQLDGLYTLQLTVLENSGSYQRSTVQVTVDNTPPAARVIHPDDGAVYTMEDDEYVNIQIDAQDNISLGKVEFYLDGHQIGLSTVAPYSKRWTIVMSDTVLSPEIEGTHVITVGEELILSQVFTSGLGIISSTVGYTETHLIHAVAYDSAGGQTETGKVRIFIVHREEEKPESNAEALLHIWEDETARTLNRRRVLGG